MIEMDCEWDFLGEFKSSRSFDLIVCQIKCTYGDLKNYLPIR